MCLINHLWGKGVCICGGVLDGCIIAHINYVSAPELTLTLQHNVFSLMPHGSVKANNPKRKSKQHVRNQRITTSIQRETTNANLYINYAQPLLHIYYMQDVNAFTCIKKFRCWNLPKTSLLLPESERTVQGVCFLKVCERV